MVTLRRNSIVRYTRRGDMIILMLTFKRRPGVSRRMVRMAGIHMTALMAGFTKPGFVLMRRRAAWINCTIRTTHSSRA